jgi:hypothetical protein
VHNLAVVDSLERQVQMIRAEIMLEEILALIYRSEVAEAEEVRHCLDSLLHAGLGR